MGFTNFLKQGDYINIRDIYLSKQEKRVSGTVNYYESIGGEKVTSMSFDLDREQSKEDYISKEKSLLISPEAPNWEKLEADSKEYMAKLKAYESDIETYASAVKKIKEDAEISNLFDVYFDRKKLYKTSNVESQFYEWLKTMDVFSGVTDVLEDEDA